MGRQEDSLLNTEPNNSHTRIEQLDYLKCLFILLMIVFHLAYIGDGYPYMKRFVYTFHMPGFLIISGYLMNIHKNLRGFSRTMLWIAVPYTIMESGYVVMASLLPIRDHIANLTPMVFLDKLLLHPLGPYWYLQTLLICGTIYFCIFKFIKSSLVSHMIITGLAYYAVSVAGVISFSSAMYFLAGLTIRNSSIKFTSIFQPSWWAVVPLCLLFFHEPSLDRATVGGMMIVYCVVAFALALYPQIPRRLQSKMLFLGRNSLALYIFSPIFTMLCKPLIPYLSFDSTHLLFLFVSLAICIAGSLSLCRILDLLHLSPFLFGSRKSMK